MTSLQDNTQLSQRFKSDIDVHFE